MTIKESYEPKKASGGAVEDAEFAFLSSNYLAQEKLDGQRYLVFLDVDGEVRILSRNASKKTGEDHVDKTAQLQHIADEVKHMFPPGTVLDGEVCVPRSQGNSHSTKVSSVTGATPENALAFQQEHGFVEYAIFDILAFDGEDLTAFPLLARLNALEFFRIAQGESKYLYLLPYVVGEDHKRAYLEKIWKRGGEGIILKDITSVYDPKRDKAWVKVKKEREYDVICMGYEEAKATSVKKGSKAETTTKYAGQVGAIKFGQYERVPQYDELLNEIGAELVLKELGTVSGFDDAMREELTNNGEVYLGNVFTIKGQERTKNMSVRHPRFIAWRFDKDPEECIIRPDEA